MSTLEKGILIAIFVCYLVWTPIYILLHLVLLPQASLWEFELPLLLVITAAAFAKYRTKVLRNSSFLLLLGYGVVSLMEPVSRSFVSHIVAYGLYASGLATLYWLGENSRATPLVCKIFLFALGFYAYKVFLLLCITVTLYFLFFLPEELGSPVIGDMFWGGGRSFVINTWPMILLAAFILIRNTRKPKQTQIPATEPSTDAR